ncbi:MULTISPECIES: aldehyde dehydrogenase [unclassified Agarivorans]|uniref:aldehyde dehydrogenase n=1 Tax=unclassified Agarivorans TaxID=2636026 RepID=UPI0026E475AC|nr:MULTISPECIES: aldehyde dehydrogenase [unclassified Agarivorans]MDO6683829.1 aldehyde dehydrogenase [Agarivorans sp. 3_MG-2023]MDO6714438.1 aldehyde dehydrogenase [Agarivorans sp. 2_MG-2023]MDO6762325.1 aldehyde dehydrogenase [Agarivorans sp. 1_MG-2023]
MNTVSHKMFIDGEWRVSATGNTIEVVNPTNEQVVGYAPQASREEAAQALRSSELAQKEWASLPAQARADLVSALADALEADAERYAVMLTQEQGKLLSDARGEVAGSVGFLRYAAESARRIEGEIVTSENQDEQIWIQRVPFGVTVGLLAWNYPLALAARKLGNALVTGNTMVVMPPADTPLTVLEFSKLIAQVGFPKGVVNIVSGLGGEVGDELVRNPITKLVTLTGSSEVGSILYRSASENITALNLELGGKAPFIVLDDANVDEVVEIAVNSGFGNCGQICTSNERMYIHQSIYAEFMDKFIAKVKQLKVGDPMLEGTNVGPKVNAREVEKLVEMIAKAKADGATIACGGSKPAGQEFTKGYWFEPTVVTNVTNDMDIMKQEVFGPIVAAMPIDSLEQALQYANDIDLGLSGYVYTNDMRKIMQVVNQLEVGEIYVNRPNGELLNGFHTGFKRSGIGGEDGKYGLEGYLQKKTIYLNYQ